MLARYYSELLNYFARALNDRDAAADVVQECYARVIGMRTQAAVLDLRALLYRTAKNIVVDRHRRALLRDHDDVDELELEAPPSCEPEAALASRRRTDALLAAIEALPPRCREAFVLHKFEGLPHAEIARRMGISRNMVEKHVINGVLACQRCLDRLESDER